MKIDYLPAKCYTENMEKWRVYRPEGKENIMKITADYHPKSERIERILRGLNDEILLTKEDAPNSGGEWDAIARCISGPYRYYTMSASCRETNELVAHWCNCERRYIFSAPIDLPDFPGLVIEGDDEAYEPTAEEIHENIKHIILTSVYYFEQQLQDFYCLHMSEEEVNALRVIDRIHGWNASITIGHDSPGECSENIVLFDNVTAASIVARHKEVIEKSRYSTK